MVLICLKKSPLLAGYALIYFIVAFLNRREPQTSFEYLPILRLR